MEDDSLGDSVTDAALFFKMNVCMMKPERIRESGVRTHKLRWRHSEQAFLLTPVLALTSYLFFTLTHSYPTVTTLPRAISHNISVDRPTCQKMTGIKYDTQS